MAGLSILVPAPELASAASEWILANLALAARSVHARFQSENAPVETNCLASDVSHETRRARCVRELRARSQPGDRLLLLNQ